MGKQPYIPLYIGDWEQDLNCVSLEAEGAALKLIFKLWKSKTRGLVSICFSQMAILLKKSEPETRKIFEELRRNDIFSVKDLDENTVEIISRRMVRDAQLSKVRSETGSKGGRPAKPKQKQTETKPKPKAKQNPEYEYEYDNEVDNEVKGGVGEKSLHVKMRELFIEVYKLKKGLPYAWDGMSGKHLNGIAGRIKLMIPEPTDESILTFWQTMLEHLPDWYLSNGFSPAIINSKFNEITSKINKPNVTNNATTDKQLADVLKRGNPYARTSN